MTLEASNHEKVNPNPAYAQSRLFGANDAGPRPRTDAFFLRIGKNFSSATGLIARAAGRIHVNGKLTAADYGHFLPGFERLIRLPVLLDMTGVHGWTAGALGADTKCAMQHFHDVQRLAVVGEKKWQEGGATFCTPLTKATVRHLDPTEAAQACTWLGEA